MLVFDPASANDVGELFAAAMVKGGKEECDEKGRQAH